MRVRLLAIVLALVAMLVLGLGIPLAISVAGREQQRTFLDRLTDTSRFASLAERALKQDRPNLITADLKRYQEVYGIPAAVFDPERHVVAASGTPVNVSSPSVVAQMNAALVGREPEAGELLVPWSSEPMVIAEPVRLDGELRGVAVTVSSTAAARGRILQWWTALAAAALLAFGMAVLLALPVVRWILRPVRRLDAATSGLAAAVVAGEKVLSVGAGTGPPELRRLSRSFDAMAAGVSDVFAAQRAFVADASHQLRNPLTALRLRLSNLGDHVHGEAAAEQTAAVAEADRLTRIADDLLAMARAEVATAELVEVDVDEVVTRRLAAWQVAAISRGVDLVLAGGRGGAALAPARGLEVVLDALLDNAVKFTGEGTAIEVAVRRTDAVVLLTVRDHGSGLRPQDLDRATDRFWRASRHQNVSGSGLGLAIVRRIVERSSGALQLDLPADGGLRVTVELPRATS